MKRKSRRRKEEERKEICSEFQKLGFKYQEPTLKDQLALEIYTLNLRLEKAQKCCITNFLYPERST